MDAKEELLKLTLGKTLGGLLLLIGFLILVVWRETLFGKWEQIAGGLSKPALLAMLGLAVIAAAIEGICIAYLVYLVYRARQATQTAPPIQAKKPTRAYGVHWDEDLFPLCPVCDVFLPIRFNDKRYEVLFCPKCKVDYILRDDYGERVSLVDAKLELEDPTK